MSTTARGRVLKRRTNVVALGISTEGEKLALGLWQGSTENATVAQAFQGVLADRLQQPEPRLVVLVPGLAPDEAAVHERAHRVQDAPVGPAAHRLRLGQDETAREHPQPEEQHLLVRGQQAEAPVQGVLQGPLPLGQVRSAAGQHVHAVDESQAA